MRKLALFLIVPFLILMAACSSDAGTEKKSKEASEKETTVEEKEAVEQEEEEPEFENVYPLTGEPTDEEVDHRAISVMVNNHTRARPQSGLSEADVVYEVLAEGQITRFLALFHSQIPDTIGPVRSARPYYFELAAGYDAVYVYHGASAAINNKVQSSGIDFVNGAKYDNNGWLFMRSNERKAPHNSYLLSDGLDRVLEQKGYDTDMTIEALPFAEESSGEGQAVNDVKITYSERPQETVTYTVDQENGTFLRSSDGQPSNDSNNGERLELENVFIVETNHKIIDNVGRRDVNLTAGGTGYLLQNGKMQEVEWQSENGRILPYKDGEPLAFTPGQTWVNVIPANATVEAN
ncbi:DUF3048 domain-containing protein [Halobacillus yeomjeoni]|uniref:DUF3048 domain-containing protein n=1 Tax=Halobacillus yeomjeoni TaxID=311194 RepID=UPI001CD1ED34|nr:DUF3048 domain-containing protein [Halobacillus yeomjeoni]MCA0984369.1 DUF3048 domain-containing protein [Halobacillus yeomjeoni]